MNTPDLPEKANPFGDPGRPNEQPWRDPTVKRPGVLTAICILGIVLGLLGILSGISKLVNTIFGAQMQRMYAGMGAVNADMQKAQADMNAAMLQVMEPFYMPNLLLGIAQLALCGALVYGAIKTLNLKEAGRKILVWALMLLLVYEVAQAVTVVWMQMQMIPVMETHMSKVMASAPGSNQGTEQLGSAIARASMMAGLLFQGLWTLLKLGLFAFAVRYLRLEKIRGLFREVAPITAELSQS